VKLSWAQALDVAKRFAPKPGQVLVFSGDGSVLHSWHAQSGTSQVWGEVYACRGDEALGVRVARVSSADLEARRTPAFGTPW